GRGAATSYPVVTYTTPTEVLGHYNASGEGEVFSFGARGDYTITHVTHVTTGVCRSKAVQFEHGGYKFDGKTLTMTVKDSYGVFSVCSGAPKREDAAKLPGPRTYDVGKSDDGRLIMVGPSCGAISELYCSPH